MKVTVTPLGTDARCSRNNNWRVVGRSYFLDTIQEEFARDGLGTSALRFLVNARISFSALKC